MKLEGGRGGLLKGGSNYLSRFTELFIRENTGLLTIECN